MRSVPRQAASFIRSIGVPSIWSSSTSQRQYGRRAREQELTVAGVLPSSLKATKKDLEVLAPDRVEGTRHAALGVEGVEPIEGPEVGADRALAVALGRHTEAHGAQGWQDAMKRLSTWGPAQSMSANHEEDPRPL
jgi:hypothetical protein